MVGRLEEWKVEEEYWRASKLDRENRVGGRNDFGGKVCCSPSTPLSGTVVYTLTV